MPLSLGVHPRLFFPVSGTPGSELPEQGRGTRVPEEWQVWLGWEGTKPRGHAIASRSAGCEFLYVAKIMRPRTLGLESKLLQIFGVPQGISRQLMQMWMDHVLTGFFINNWLNFIDGESSRFRSFPSWYRSISIHIPSFPICSQHGSCLTFSFPLLLDSMLLSFSKSRGKHWNTFFLFVKVNDLWG